MSAYQDPIGTLIQGLLAGHNMGLRIKQQKLDEEAFARKQALDDEESDVRRVMNEMRIREAGGLAVNDGMVEETMPDIVIPGDLGGGIRLPDSRMPGGKVLRKAKNVVTLKGRTGARSYELPDEETQLRRQRRLADAETESQLEKTQRQMALKMQMEMDAERRQREESGIDLSQMFEGRYGNRRVLPTELDEVARFEQVLNPKPERPQYHPHTDYESGNVTYSAVDPASGKLLVVEGPRGAAKPRPRSDSSSRPKQPTYTETVQRLAGRAIEDSIRGGGNGYEDAIRNVEQHYENDPEMKKYRAGVLNFIKTLRNKDRLTRRDSLADLKAKIGGGRGGRSAGSPGGKIANAADVAAYAKAKGISEAKAREEFTASGYSVK